MKQLFLLIFITAFTNFSFAQYAEELITRPEKSWYTETSTYADVKEFVNYLKDNSDLVHVESMFTSTEGKDVPLVVLANPAISTPEESKASDKIVIYIQANIHGGEVEGKEAVMMMMREILFGPKKHLLDNQIILFMPIYNADGNDKMGPDNRRSQEGSPKLAGERRSGGDFDLNRDGMKVEAIETKGLLKMMTKWDPDFLVDLHTTNGTWHGNSLTYAPSYHHAGHPATSEYTMDVMLPALKKALLENDNIYIDIYGGYSLRQGWPPKALYTYNHHPRYLVNQLGLRNKMAILSETFAHDRFDLRINAAHAFVNGILEYTNYHSEEIIAINEKARIETLAKIENEGGSFKNGVRFKMIPTPKPLKLRTYEYISYEEDGVSKYARTGNIISIDNVENYNAFEATLESTVPKAYIFPSELNAIAEKLEEHGIHVQRLTKSQSFMGEAFLVDTIKHAQRKFEGHNMATLSGEFESSTKNFKKGDYKIDMNQPLANLIFYLLEPQSDDGLATWNFFDEHLKKNGIDTQSVEYPVFKQL